MEPEQSSNPPNLRNPWWKRLWNRIISQKTTIVISLTVAFFGNGILKWSSIKPSDPTSFSISKVSDNFQFAESLNLKNDQGSSGFLENISGRLTYYNTGKFFTTFKIDSVSIDHTDKEAFTEVELPAGHIIKGHFQFSQSSEIRAVWQAGVVYRVDFTTSLINTVAFFHFNSTKTTSYIFSLSESNIRAINENKTKQNATETTIILTKID